MMKNNAERIIENLGLVAFNSMQIQAQEKLLQQMMKLY